MPGSSILAILAGPVFGPYLGFTIVHLASVGGACISYALSSHFGSNLIKEKFPDKFQWFQDKIRENQHNLFYYFLFLRLAPVAPNLFLNASAGLVGVPFWTFLTASLVGQLPFTYLLIQTGLMLDHMTTLGGPDLYVSKALCEILL